MKQKINLRLTIIAMIAMISTTIGTILVFYNLFQNQVKADLIMCGQMLADTGVFQRLYAEEGEDYQKELQKLERDNLRITWINQDGTVIYDNDANYAVLENHLDRPEIQEALQCGEGESVRKSSTLNMNTFNYAILLLDGTVLRVSMQARTISSVFIVALPVILIIMLVILVLCVSLGHLLTAQLLRPIEHMAEHLDEGTDKYVYKEMIPFMDKIRSQHENILSSVRIRQDFTANVSHELKTPLTAISGYAELLENHMVGEGQEEYIATQIHKNADRLLTLINDIIRLSELDHNEIARQFFTVDLKELAEKCCDRLQMNAIKKNVSLTCVGTSAYFNVDKDLITEMLDNLIQNAIQYNNANGEVKVWTGIEDNHPVLRVKDNGIGIPRNHQERIFERFYRVDKSRSRETGGTGLGLAIVKHIAEIHGAEILLVSEPEKGTEISVKF